jgi:hypothetical protein
MTNTVRTAAVSFLLFIAIWNRAQNRNTPDIHFRMAKWLEAAWTGGDRHLLLMAFRSAGKSTMTGLFVAWLLYRHPALRILVVAADEALATKMVRNARRIIERHPLTAHLKPDRAEQWAGDRFTVRRQVEWRDPSVMAKGIAANVTGCRADVIIYDDVEVPNTCDTAAKRADLRTRLGELSFVLMNGGTQLYVGTPHSYYTIYAVGARAEIGEEQPFLSGYKRLTLPIVDARGQPAWPERYTPADIVQLKQQAGPNKFASQMMLEPVNMAEGRLNATLLQIYDSCVQYDKILRSLYIGEHKMIGASAWWDPAFGAVKGDHSVCAVVFADAQGNVYIHRVEYIKIDDHDDQDNATAQCRIVARIAKALMLPAICIETNGIGKFLPAILRNELARRNAPCRVIEKTSSRAKSIRILEAFDAPLAAQRLFVHEDVLQTPFVMELQEWTPDNTRGRDDGLDAVAGALSEQPVRLPRLYSYRPPPDWRG